MSSRGFTRLATTWYTLRAAASQIFHAGFMPLPTFIPRFSLPYRLGGHKVVILFALAIIFYLQHPFLFTRWSTSYIGGFRADAGIYVYLESVNASGFFSWPSHGFDIPIFYPWNRALGFSDNFLLPALLAKLLVPLFGSEAFVYNLILVSAMVLNGFCTYLLAHKVTKSTPASFFAGLVFMNFPYFVFHRGHPQLQFAFWLPLALLATLSFVENRSWRSATGIGACVAGAFFCSVYYAMYAYFFVGVTLLGYLFLRPRSWKIRDIATLGLSNLPWIVLLAPSAIAYMQTRDSMGTNPLSVLQRHSPPLSAFIAPPQAGLFFNRYVRNLSWMEGYLYFGYLALLIAVVAILRWGFEMWRSEGDASNRKTRRLCLLSMCVISLYGTIRTYYFAMHPGSRTAHHIAWVQSETFWVLIIASLFLIISLGRRATERALSAREYTGLFLFVSLVTIFATLGIKDGGKVSLHAPELYRFVAKLPGFEGLRGLARMGILSVLSLLVLAALGLATLLKKERFAKPATQWGIVAGLSLLSAFELRTSRERLAPTIPAPPIYEAAAHLPTNEAVVALPTRSALKNGRNFMNWNSLHMIWMRHAKNRLVNGFSGKAPWLHSFYTHHLDSFPSRPSLSMIGSIVGVRYVITNSTFYGERFAKKINILVKKYRSEIELISCDGTGSCIYKVTPIIHTSALPEKQLVLPPGRHERALSFEMKAEGETSTQPVNVTLKVDIGTKRNVAQLSVPLTKPGSWTPVTLQLPKNDEWVSPTVVTVQVEGAPGIMIRETKLTP